MEVKEKTDEEITADAVRAARIAIKAAQASVKDGGHKASIDYARAAEAAIGQTVALEVAKPTVKLSGGTIESVGKVEKIVDVVRVSSHP